MILISFKVRFAYQTSSHILQKNLMRKNSLSFYTAITISIFFCLFLFQSCNSEQEFLNRSEVETDGPQEALERDIEMMKDPATGKVPVERLLSAFAYKRDLSQARLAGTIPNVNWTSFGPKNQGGRTRAMIVDRNDATGNTLFAGSVGGGLWKTTNINVAEPNWAPVNELLENLAVTSIAQNPGNPQIMYMGTGEGYGNTDAIRGLGIFKSSNGGATWSQLPATNITAFYYIMKMQVMSNGVLLVATRTAGLYRSTDGGASFTKVLGSGMGITGANSNLCYDVQISKDGDVYSSLNGSIHKSTDGGVSFGAAIATPITLERVEIGCAPSDNNVIYLLVEKGNVVEGILRSADAGATFVSKTEPADGDTGIPAADFSRGQAWYDLTIAVDPNDANTLIVGGVDAFKSTTGADTWTQFTHWYGGFGFQNMHADQHYFFYKNNSSSVAYFANDGGIYQSTNMTATVPTVANKGTNYNTIQFYACAIEPTAGKAHYLAGAQDNGSHKFTSNNIANSVQVTGGDGAFCHIDQNEPQYQFTSYVYNAFYRSSNNGVSFTSVNSGGSTGRFINPTDYDDIDNKLYAAKGTNEYLIWMNPQTGNTFETKSNSTLGGQVSAVTVSPKTPTNVYFGTSNGRIVKVEDAAGVAPISTYLGNPTGGSAYVSCIEIEKNNDNHLIVTFSNYGVNSIWETVNGGTNWASIEGNLPDIPVRWALLNPNNNKQLLIATELGVWSTDNISGSSTSWGATNSGLANVRVDMLQLRSSDGYVIAATHGRGLFGSDAFTQPTAGISVTQKVGYIGSLIQFNSNSFQDVSWLWDFGDGTTSTLKNPTHAYAAAGIYTVKLTINGGVSTAIQTNLIQILPNKNVPYLLVDGGNFETNPNDFGPNTISGTAWERGNSTVAGKNGTNSGNNAWVTGLTSAVYADKGESQLWSPNYNFAGQTTLNLSFYAKFNTEPEYDGFRIEYSTDKGVNWLPLGTTTAPNWYNFANTVQNTSFPKNEAFFAGNVSTVFTQYTRDVSFLAGNTNVAFRVNFKSDDNTAGPGAVIDDWMISGTTAPPPAYALTSFTAAKVSNNVQLNWTSVNEIGYDKYYIQRSTTPTGFTDIANVNATNLPSNSYSYLDQVSALNPPPTGILYYRLRITKAGSADGFSQVVQVDFTPPVVYALTSFTGVKVNNNVQLNWTSVNEVGYNKYYIQRSAMPTGFSDIDSVNAKNLPSNSYSYLDLTSNLNPAPIGIFYYRLRITKAGSPDVFSSVVQINFPPAPVYALTTFTAMRVNFDVQLNWTTVNETMFSKYFIQRGTTPTSFVDIASKDALNGASNSYSYVDMTSLLLPRPNGKLYYRLRITRIGLPDTFSEIKEVDFTGTATATIFSVGPNPFTNYVNIVSPVPIRAILLIASNGQVVQRSSNFSGGRWTIGNQLPAGMYILKIMTTDGKEIIRKLVK